MSEEFDFEAYERRAFNRAYALKGEYDGLLHPPSALSDYPKAEAFEAASFAARYERFCDEREALACTAGTWPPAPTIPEWVEPWAAEVRRLCVPALTLSPAEETRRLRSATKDCEDVAWVVSYVETDRPCDGCDAPMWHVMRVDLEPIGIDGMLQLWWCEGCAPESSNDKGASLEIVARSEPLPAADDDDPEIETFLGMPGYSFPHLAAIGREPPEGTAARALDEQLVVQDPKRGNLDRFYSALELAIAGEGGFTTGRCCIGGFPEFQQDDMTPACASCSKPMFLLAQCEMFGAVNFYFFGCHRTPSCAGLSNPVFVAQT